MSKLNIFKSLFNSIIKSKSNTPVFKGSDLFGNKYYEVVYDDNKVKPKRYIGHEDIQDIQVPKIPSQWEAWLRFTRDDPPTLEELQYHEQRIDTVKKKAKDLEIKYDKDRQELIDKGMISGADMKGSSSNQSSAFPIREEYESPDSGEFRKK